jgi:hypothetical protein
MYAEVALRADVFGSSDAVAPDLAAPPADGGETPAHPVAAKSAAPAAVRTSVHALRRTLTFRWPPPPQEPARQVKYGRARERDDRMTVPSFTRAMLLLVAAGAMLGGCGPRASGNLVLPASTAQQLAAASQPLLYVSDWATNAVVVYDYATRDAIGRLRGLQHPSGQCVDRKHDIWIADFAASEVVKYAHGGKTPLKRFKTDGYPIGCSVDFTSGSLVVANYYTPHGSGDLQVWKYGGGTPVSYKSSSLRYFWPPAYDNHGNIFVEGEHHDGRYGVADLPRGGSSLHIMTLQGATIHFAAAALWDGTNLALTDQAGGGGSTTVIYRTTVSGNVVKVSGRTYLNDTCHGKASDVEQPFIVRTNSDADTVVGGNLSCSNRVGFWNYPAGGRPSAALDDAPLEPFGVSFSP